MRRFLEWLLSFFKSPKPKNLQGLENTKKNLENELKEIDNEKPNTNDLLDHFNNK